MEENLKRSFRLSIENSIDNLYLIVVLNNTEMIFSYLKQLENDLLKIFEDIYQDTFSANKMIISGIEDIKIVNEKLLKKFINRNLGIIISQLINSQIK